MKFYTIFLILGLANLVYGQNPSDQLIKYTGTVIDADSENFVDFANVSLYDAETDAFITGAITDLDGNFELQSDDKTVYVQIEFVGYDTKKVSEYTIDGAVASFGRLLIESQAEMLEEVTVTAERSTTEFKTDRRVFNVGADLTSSGASALEVLNNVPSVNVDIEGAVTLRGSSGVQMLLNGKPSVLADEESGALGNITADMIEKIEVITNPSAKYEAEGTSGIINIVLKKNNKKAVNGSVTLNVGTPANHSVGLSLNKRTEKFNLFTQLGVGYKEREYNTINTNTNLINGVALNSKGTEARNEGFYNLVLGADYYFNPLNVLTLSGSFSYETEDQPSLTEFSLTDGSMSSIWNRSESTTATNPKLQYELQYKKEFEDNKEHQFSFSAIGNYFGKDQSSVFTETLLDGNIGLSDQLTATNFKEGKFTFNLDYTKPISDEFSIETGAQYVDNQVSNDYSVEDFKDGEYVVNPGLTNLFEYDQKVFGTYVTGAYEGIVWGLKLGARLEQTNLSTLLTNTGEANDQSFLNLFPSAHTSFKVNERVSLQAGYSRRIYRPRLWDLNPFFNIRNNFSIRAGNPLLMPEYTDSYEIGSVFIYEKVTFNVNLYRRFTTDKIDRIATFEDNVTINSPYNIGTADTKGIEVNFKYTPLKKITLNGDFNFNFFNREGTFGDQDFDFSNDQWSTKLTSKFKFSKQFDLEATGRYSSAVQTVQGTRADNIWMDFGARYKIKGGKFVLNLSVRDAFASRVRESFVYAEDFENYSFRQIGRFVTFGVSYGFGKGEAMTYGGGGGRRR